MEKRGLLFDASQFAAMLGATRRDSNSAVSEAQPEATVWLEDETATLEAGYARRHGRINYQGRNYALIHSGLSIAGRGGAYAASGEGTTQSPNRTAPLEYLGLGDFGVSRSRLVVIPHV